MRTGRIGAGVSTLVVLVASTMGIDAKPALHFSSHERSACRSDAFRYCAYTYPSKRRLVACLQSHRTSLADACRVALRRGVSERPSLSH